MAHKDRLTRFGFEYLGHVPGKGDCQTIVANRESLSPQVEMVQGCLAIVHAFSCRMYGLCCYGKTLTGELVGGGR